MGSSALAAHHGLTEQQWRILRALAAIDAIEVTNSRGCLSLVQPFRFLRDLRRRQLIERKTRADLSRAVVSDSRKA